MRDAKFSELLASSSISEIPTVACLDEAGKEIAQVGEYRMLCALQAS